MKLNTTLLRNANIFIMRHKPDINYIKFDKSTLFQRLRSIKNSFISFEYQHRKTTINLDKLRQKLVREIDKSSQYQIKHGLIPDMTKVNKNTLSIMRQRWMAQENVTLPSGAVNISNDVVGKTNLLACRDTKEVVFAQVNNMMDLKYPAELRSGCAQSSTAQILRSSRYLEKKIALLDITTGNRNDNCDKESYIRNILKEEMYKKLFSGSSYSFVDIPLLKLYTTVISLSEFRKNTAESDA